MADKTVTLADSEWQQLVAIIANATGFMTFQKLLNQLQAQERQTVMKQPEDGQLRDLPESLRRMPTT